MDMRDSLRVLLHARTDWLGERVKQDVWQVVMFMCPEEHGEEVEWQPVEGESSTRKLPNVEPTYGCRGHVGLHGPFTGPETNEG